MLGSGIDGLLGVLAALEQPALRIRPRQCTRLRHRRSTCALCSEACPTGAISWGTSLEVDPRSCSACGACASACPTGAIEPRSPTGPELVGRIRELAKHQPVVAIACRSYLESTTQAPGACLRVDCIGRVDEAVLVGAVAWGAERVVLVDGQCASCRNATVRQRMETIVERSRELLQAVGASASISFAPDLPRGQAPAVRVGGVSRRGFFSLLAGRASQAGPAGTEAILGPSEEARGADDPKPGDLPTFLPTRRRLLLAAVARLGRPTVSELHGGNGFWAEASLTERCIGCRACAQFCPTGALTKTEVEGRAALGFTAAHCTGCLLCRDLCYWKAVRLSPSVAAEAALAGTTVTWMTDEKGAGGGARSLR